MAILCVIDGLPTQSLVAGGSGGMTTTLPGCATVLTGYRGAHFEGFEGAGAFSSLSLTWFICFF